MQTERITLDRTEARRLWRDYRKHQHWSVPIDREVMTTYQAIAQGKVVIRALDSIRAAGLNEEGLPKLAIARADAVWCWLNASRMGSVIFASTEAAMWNETHQRQRIVMPAGTFPGIAQRWRSRAIVPQIPLPLRPKRGLANYHILWEAEWEPIPPTDPMLLRRVGLSDLWIVCAAWDLTEVERAVLAGRIRA